MKGTGYFRPRTLEELQQQQGGGNSPPAPSKGSIGLTASRQPPPPPNPPPRPPADAWAVGRTAAGPGSGANRGLHHTGAGLRRPPGTCSEQQRHSLTAGDRNRPVSTPSCASPDSASASVSSWESGRGATLHDTRHGAGRAHPDSPASSSAAGAQPRPAAATSSGTAHAASTPCASRPSSISWSGSGSSYGRAPTVVALVGSNPGGPFAQQRVSLPGAAASVQQRMQPAMHPAGSGSAGTAHTALYGSQQQGAAAASAAVCGTYLHLQPQQQGWLQQSQPRASYQTPQPRQQQAYETAAQAQWQQSQPGQPAVLPQHVQQTFVQQPQQQVFALPQQQQLQQLGMPAQAVQPGLVWQPQPQQQQPQQQQVVLLVMQQPQQGCLTDTQSGGVLQQPQVLTQTQQVQHMAAVGISSPPSSGNTPVDTAELLRHRVAAARISAAAAGDQQALLGLPSCSSSGAMHILAPTVMSAGWAGPSQLLQPGPYDPSGLVLTGHNSNSYYHTPLLSSTPDSSCSVSLLSSNYDSRSLTLAGEVPSCQLEQGLDTSSSVLAVRSSGSASSSTARVPDSIQPSCPVLQQQPLEQGGMLLLGDTQQQQQQQLQRSDVAQLAAAAAQDRLEQLAAVEALHQQLKADILRLLPLI